MKPRNTYLTLGVVSGLFLLLMVAIAMPAAAWVWPCFTCGDHHTGTCPDGLVCMVTGQDCHTDYNPCPEQGYVSCDGSHHEKQIIIPSHWEEQCTQIPFWQAHDYHNQGDCVSTYTHHPYHQTAGQAVATCTAQVSDCNNVYVPTVYGPCQVCPSHQDCIDNYGCRACPEGQHKDGDNLCVPDVCGLSFCTGTGHFCVDGMCQSPSACADSILGEYTWTYLGYTHDMILDQYNPATGHVGGHGTFTGGVAPADGTKWVLNGTLYDDTFTFTVVYTEGPRVPYSLTTTGSTVNCALITGDGWTLVRYIPPQPSSSGYFTFTSQAMVGSSGSCESNIPALADIALSILEGRHLNVWVTSTGIIDGARVFYYHDSNEVSFNADCTQKQYFSRCSQDGQSGVGTLVFQMYGPLQRFRVVAAKPYTSTPGGHQISIKIVDPLTTKVLWPLSVVDQKLATTHGNEMSYDHTFGLTQDYQLCRVQNFESDGWIFGIPTL